MRWSLNKSHGIVCRVLFLIKPVACFLQCVVTILFLVIAGNAAAQTCTIISSVPARPPKSGQFDILVSSPAPGYYSVKGSKIFDSYDINGIGPSVQIDTANYFWIDKNTINPGPMNRCAVWGQSNPQKIGFSVCVNAPQNKTYYFGFGADNSGVLTIDGNVVLRNIDFEYWGIYKVSLTKGEHLVEFSVINFQAEAAIGFEIYDNTLAEIMNATGYGEMKLIYSTRQEFGAPVQEGDSTSSYSCPAGNILNYCTPGVPVCSKFVPITLTINNPPPACSSSSVDITVPQITAGSPTSLTYSYWTDSLATLPLANPDKVTKSGTYYIMGSSNGCYLIKPVNVLVSSVSTTIEKTICPGDSYQGYNKTGSYLSTFKASNGCDSLVTLNLTVSPVVNLGADRNLCPGDSILLAPGTYSQYLWQDNSTGSQYVVKTPGTYWVTVTDQNGCSSADTVVVRTVDCFDFKIPNTFTPNGDGVNDTWNLGSLQDFPQCTVFIYNRWGLAVFKSNGYATPWDGTYKDKKLPTGTYYYIIDLKNNTPPLSGFVTIVR
jgi:gliding motility-associated-like protein